MTNLFWNNAGLWDFVLLNWEGEEVQSLCLPWNRIDINWNEIDFTWDEICILEKITSDISIDGNKKVNRKYIKKKVESLSKQEQKTLIKLFFKLNDIEIKDEKELKNIEVSIDDIEVLLNKALKVEITF